ncbi:Plug domain-containing protein [Kaistella anthropi]|nr:Plug domain-containing protein [Kaistella anthropi]
MKKLVCSVLFLGVIGMFSAQEKESEISEITVQGKFLNLPLKKVNENITVISKQELENSPAKSIEEVLAQFTGMDIRKRGANGVQADISVRGSSFEQVLILVNGIRINDSQTGHNSMSIPFDLASVEKIEIVKVMLHVVLGKMLMQELLILSPNLLPMRISFLRQVAEISKPIL